MFHKICFYLMRLNGWEFKIEIPTELKSFVAIGAPHTSNWDFFPAMAMISVLNRNARFILKDSWLKFPLGILLESMGALGIDRESIQKDSQSNTTDMISDLFKTYPELVLLISPEGTRKPNDTWKTGFYYIAKKANVPIVLGYADYEKKIVGVGKVIYPSDYEKDMKTITDFYRTINACKPANFKLDKRFS